MVVVPVAPSTSAVRRPDGLAETIVVDRQPLFLAALASLLGGSGYAANVRTESRSDVALSAIRAGQIDLVCCELHAEPISGLELVQTLEQEGLETPVILLGDDGDQGDLTAALAGSASGLFTKSAEPEEFLSGVRAVLSGHRAIGSAVISELLHRSTSHGANEARRHHHQLSPTELEILSMIGRAESIPAIAASRGISHKTVRNHLAKIYRKLELHGRTEAMLWAARMGLTNS